MTQAPERLSREEKKARTRAQLIDAAATVFARHGYAAASLDEVAEEAGLTKGAVYSNFDSKEDLFQAVVDDRLNEPMMQIADVIDSAESFEQQAMAGARMYADVFEQQRSVYLLALEFDIYMARHPEYATKFADRWRERHEQIADLIAEHAEKSDTALPLPADEMAVVVTALSQGVALRKLADPDAVPDDLLGRVYALLFRPAPDA